MGITKLCNLHIHNSNSGCCWNRYPIKLLYEEAFNANLQFCGSTNHISPPLGINPEGQPADVFQRHLRWTKEEIDGLETKIPIYLGAELDIKDGTGKHYLMPEYSEILDYWIAGMHSFYKEDMLAKFYERGEQEDFLPDYFEEWGDWAEIYIRKSRPNVFVHPFWQELENGIVHEKLMLETAIRFFSAAADVGTAIECSSLQIRRRFWKKPFWDSTNSTKDPQAVFMDIYTKLFRLAKETGCQVAFGSDAHIPEQIKDVITIKNLLESVGFTDKDIYQPVKRK